MTAHAQRRKQLIDTLSVLENLVRVIELRRSINQADNQPHLSFWILINNALFDEAVLDWCKLFGSDDAVNQPTHWKNVVPDAEHNTFRSELYTTAGTDKAGWQAYWNQMKEYRDNAVAHHSEKRRHISSFPRHDLALNSAHCFYELVTRLLKSELNVDSEHTSLRDYAKNFAAQAQEIAKIAVAATTHLREGID